MNSNEFWCRAFLTTMAPVFQACIGTGAKEDNVAAQCADMADAALAVAQRRGMVTGSAEPPRSPTAAFDALQRASLRWLAAAKTNDEAEFEAAGEALLKAAKAIDSGRAPAESPVPEPVEFTAEHDGGMWIIRSPSFAGDVWAHDSNAFAATDSGTTIRIQWGETCPPKPIKVWLERKGGA